MPYMLVYTPSLHNAREFLAFPRLGQQLK